MLDLPLLVGIEEIGRDLKEIADPVLDRRYAFIYGSGGVTLTVEEADKVLYGQEIQRTIAEPVDESLDVITVVVLRTGKHRPPVLVSW